MESCFSSYSLNISVNEFGKKFQDARIFYANFNVFNVKYRNKLLNFWFLYFQFIEMQR